MNKFHSITPVLGDWHSSYRWSHLLDPLIHLEERSSTSVCVLSVYSESLPQFGGVQYDHFHQTRKNVFGRRDVIHTKPVLLFLKEYNFYLKFYCDNFVLHSCLQCVL